MAKPFNYGGQAVIEGVMMRGRRHLSVAVRGPNGEIIVRDEPLNGAVYTSAWAKLPFLRGITLLWDTLVLGIRTLLYSANVALAEEQAEITGKAMWGMMGTAMFFVVTIFFLAPLLLMGWLDRTITSSFVSNIVEGVIRIAFLVGYVWAIGLLPDIRRVFAYHGAEHKTINAWEAGAPMDVRSIQSFGTSHPRCGTAFLLLIMVISVLVFAAFGRPDWWLRAISRVVMIPLIATVGYELMRLGASHMKNRVVHAILAPGLALQSLTTRPPDDGMVEVALTAFQHVLAADAASEPAGQSQPSSSVAA